MASPENSQEQRVIDLEIKISFLEKQVEDLDELVRELGTELQGLRRQCDSLQRRMEEPQSFEAPEGTEEEPGFLA
ncbi:MAG: SlyX family protein [Planctomycetes bacterium]|nr:SlyX family protein [Planctomycetota bacterium]